jgi:hypothetical protein
MRVHRRNFRRLFRKAATSPSRLKLSALARSGRHPRMLRLVPSPRLREQARSWRIVLEQRQVRRDVCRAPKPRSLPPGQVQWRNPSEPATARVNTASSLESRVSPLASSAVRAPASSPSFNFCAAMPRQRRTAQSFASGPCSRLIQKRATFAAIGTQATPRLSVRAIPARSRRRLPAQAACARPSAPCRRQERACKNPKGGNSKSRRFAALVSVIGLFAEVSISGMRPSAARASLMSRCLSMYSPKGRSRFLAARRPRRHRRMAQHRKRELEGRQAHGSCPACAHIALTIACMSTHLRCVDLRNLT